MPNWRSTYISQIGWDIRTSADVVGGTDSRVGVEIMRGDTVVLALNVEPGGTSRLDRGESMFYSYKFQSAYFAPGEVMTWVSGLPYPQAVEFPNGIQGHLRCRFRIHGDDMWIKDNIEGYVRFTRPKGIEGTIDSMQWVDDLNWTHVGTFAQDTNMSTDSREGFTTWTLQY